MAFKGNSMAELYEYERQQNAKDFRKAMSPAQEEAAKLLVQKRLEKLKEKLNG